MALHANATKIADLFDPQVIGARLDKKLFNEIKFLPLATVNRTLEGRPGDTISLPYWTAIPTASVVVEGADIPIEKLTERTVPVQISKVGIGVQLTDEAVLNGYGDAIGEATDQMAQSIASKVDDDLVTSLSGNTVNVYAIAGSSFVADDVSDALVKFGEDIDGAKVLMVDPATYGVLRKSSAWLPASEISADIIVKGVVGMVYGCQVVVSNRLTGTSEAHIVKAGALSVFIKRDTLIETDRDIINKSTVLTADKHYAVYLANPANAIKITL